MKKIRFVAAAALVAALSIFASCTKDNTGADNDTPLTPEEALMEYIQGDWAAQGYNDPNQSQDVFFAAVHFKGEDNKLGASVSGQSVLFVDYILTLKSNDGKAIVFTGHYYDPELRAAFNIEVKVSKAGENLIKCDKIIKVAGEDSIESFIMERIADFTDFQVGGE